MAISSINRNVNTLSLTASATIGQDVDQVLCDCTSGAITVTLYPSPGDGALHEVVVEKTDSGGNAVTVTDGTFTFSLSAQYDAVQCQLTQAGAWFGISGFDRSGTGDVEGPSSATDNAIARFDATTGKIIQNSAVTVADTTGVIAGTQGVTFTGSSSGTTALVPTAAASGTLTLPAATDTLVGKATTDTLTNKTLTSPVLTTPAIGVATGTSLAATGSITSASPTTGMGYATGAGGAQTQATDKSTTVVSNTITTAITMNNATLNAATVVSFTFTNSAIAATDTVICTHQSAGTSGAYSVNAFPGAGSAVVSVRNNTAGNLSEAIVLRITVVKSVSA